MALARYRDFFWFPDGILATNAPARVFPLDSTTLATLYTDATGTTQLPNPLDTDGAGFLDFWAEEGEYWVHIGALTFRVSVGSPNMDVPEALAGGMSTGVVYGAQLQVNGSNPAAVDIPETLGYVVDHTTDPPSPTVTRVQIPAQTVALAGASLARTVTFWLVNAAGAIIQQGTEPTAAERREFLVLGATAYDTIGGSIFELVSTPQQLSQGLNQFLDLADSLGPFSVSGNLFTPNGANLQLNCTSGTLFSTGWAYSTTPKNPHIAPTAAQAPVQFRYGLRNTVAFPPLTTLVDPTRWDNNGVLTLVGGGTNRSTVQRVFKFASAAPFSQTVIQYGQVVFSSLTDAIDSIGTTNYEVNPQLGAVGSLVGWIAVTHAATNLSDPLQCRIVPAGKFARP